MRLSKMSVKHCPGIAELYITPRNLGFYECNGVEAVALGARVVQDVSHYALALYSLLRSLRKYGHPMAAYATKIIAF